MYMQTLFNIVTIALLGIVSFQIRRLQTGKKGSSNAVILDSCALIDGRIVDLATAGFTPDTLIVPAFILRELQLLADSADSQKRERARYGLDIVKSLQELSRVDVVVDQVNPNEDTVDNKLINLAKKRGAGLYTTDFNLAKVAVVEGVSVLNVHELSQKLKPNFLPGEQLKVKIIQKGSSRGQGVGYTDDGTMVVVDQAQKLIGKTVVVVVDRMINTMAGKMMFAVIAKQTIKIQSKKIEYETDLSSLV